MRTRCASGVGVQSFLRKILPPSLQVNYQEGNPLVILKTNDLAAVAVAVCLASLQWVAAKTKVSAAVAYAYQGTPTIQ